MVEIEENDPPREEEEEEEEAVEEEVVPMNPPARPRRTAFNNYLVRTINISDDATLAALNEEGLDGFNAFLTIERDDIERICKNIRRPGGTIPNPDYSPLARRRVERRIPNPGLKVAFVQQKRLEQLHYYVYHMDRTQRKLNPQLATLRRLDKTWRLFQEEEEYDQATKVEIPAQLTKVTEIRKTIENIDAYLQNKRGLSKIPLAYITREEVELPEATEDEIDLGFGQPSIKKEMIRRGSHRGIAYESDNQEVWSVLRHILHGGPGWSWISPFEDDMDGRAAYLALKRHYLGDSFQDRIKIDADKTIEKIFYDGKARNFTFEHYCEKLNTAFTDLQWSEEAVPPRRQVRILLRGIRDTRLEAAKAQIMASAHLKENFMQAIDFLAQYVDDHETITQHGGNRNRTISAVSTNSNATAEGGGGGRGRGRGRGRGYYGRGRGRGRGGGRGGRGRGDVTDRYYSFEEWSGLSQEQQQRVRDLRNERDRRRNVAAVTTDDGEQRRTRQRSGSNSSNRDQDRSVRFAAGTNMTQRNDNNPDDDQD